MEQITNQSQPMSEYQSASQKQTINTTSSKPNLSLIMGIALLFLVIGFFLNVIISQIFKKSELQETSLSQNTSGAEQVESNKNTSQNWSTYSYIFGPSLDQIKNSKSGSIKYADLTYSIKLPTSWTLTKRDNEEGINVSNISDQCNDADNTAFFDVGINKYDEKQDKNSILKMHQKSVEEFKQKAGSAKALEDVGDIEIDGHQGIKTAYYDPACLNGKSIDYYIPFENYVFHISGRNSSKVTKEFADLFDKTVNSLTFEKN